MNMNNIIMESIKNILKEEASAQSIYNEFTGEGLPNAIKAAELDNTIASKLAKNLPAVGGATAAALAAGLGALALRKKLAATKATTPVKTRLKK